MNLKGEPNRITDMIRKGLMSGAFGSTNAELSTNGIKTSVSAGTMGALCFFTPKYFKEYTPEQEPLKVILTEELHKGFSELRLTGEDEINLTVGHGDQAFKIKAGKRNWQPKISGEETKDIPFTYERTAGVGILATDPREDRQVQNQIKVSVDSLVSPKVERISFRIANGSVTMELDYDGPYTAEVEVKDSRKLDHDRTYTIFQEYLTNILSNFKGDLWLSFFEKGIFFTQENNDFSLTYYLATTA
jgi:hypothetical protein